MEVRLVFLDTHRIDMDALFASPYLSGEEIESLRRYKVQESFYEKIASQYLKNKYVGAYTISEHGKPISDSCFFNISHSKGLVVLAIGERSIGVDIEKIRPISEELKRHVTSEEEYEAMKGDSDFFRIWTNKESLLKALGKGIDRLLREVPGLPFDGVRAIDEVLFSSRTLSYGEYILSVALEGINTFEINASVEDVY